MNLDALKHTGGTVLAFGGGLGGVSLSRVNEYGSCACWVIGCVAGLCTIHSWWTKRQKKNHKKH